MSIKYKIALLFTILVALILSALSVAIFYFSTKNRLEAFRKRLENRAISTASVYAEIKNTDIDILEKIDIAVFSSLQQKAILITDSSMTRLYEYFENPSDSMSLDRKLILRLYRQPSLFYNIGDRNVIAIRYHTKPDNDFIVAVAANDIDGKETLQQLKEILFLCGAAGTLLSFFAGFFFAGRLILPLSTITKQVNLISSSNLSHRLQVKTTRDELNLLAETFNHLLDRLEESFNLQRRFISNASHELSTPLTSVSSQVEVALQKERTPAEYRTTLHSIYDDMLQLQQLTRSLLEIAKTGSQGGIELYDLRLDELLLKVMADVEKQNNGYKTEIEFGEFPEDERYLMIFGNKDLLYIALKNIIENGCKYSENLKASILASFYQDQTEIKVINKGDVITEADIQNIFQPFFRSENVQQKPGFGLGLTLSKRIIALHKGTISVESSPVKGTIFSICFPLEKQRV